jgi:acetyl esterase/lipase
MYSDTPRLALPSDTDAISETLAEAMHDDPVTAWVIPSPDRRRLLPRPAHGCGESAGGNLAAAVALRAMTEWMASLIGRWRPGSR